MNNPTTNQQKNQVSNKKSENLFFALDKRLFTNKSQECPKLTWRGALKLRFEEEPTRHTHTNLRKQKQMSDNVYSVLFVINSILLPKINDSFDFNDSGCKDYDKVLWASVNPFPKINNPIGSILALSEAEKKVLNAFLVLARNFKGHTIYASQEKAISRIAKVHRVTVNRAAKKFHDWGLIAKRNNGANKPCWYKISKFFNDRHVIESLSKALTIFYFMSATLLLSAVDRHTTQGLLDFNFIYKKLGKESNSTITVYEERDYQRKILKKKGTMFDNQVEVSDVVRKLPFKFTIDQQQQLSKYSDAQLLAAKQIIQKRKSTNNPVTLFFWLLRNDPAVITAKDLPKKTVEELQKTQQERYEQALSNSPSYQRMKQLQTNVPYEKRIASMSDSELDNELANWKNVIAKQQSNIPAFMRENLMSIAFSSQRVAQQEKVKRLLNGKIDNPFSAENLDEPYNNFESG